MKQRESGRSRQISKQRNQRNRLGSRKNDRPSILHSQRDGLGHMLCMFCLCSRHYLYTSIPKNVERNRNQWIKRWPISTSSHFNNWLLHKYVVGIDRPRRERNLNTVFFSRLNVKKTLTFPSLAISTNPSREIRTMSEWELVNTEWEDTGRFLVSTTKFTCDCLEEGSDESSDEYEIVYMDWETNFEVFHFWILLCLGPHSSRSWTR